jgi:hypothetical protein
MNYCTTCGQQINDVVIIQGLPYGTTCALNKLGLREFPSWFKVGNWDKAKLSNEELQEKNRLDFENTMRITNECWSEWCALSKAHFEQRGFEDKWAEDFIYSISRQLGYGMFLDHSQFKNNTWIKGCPTISKNPKTIDTLSLKQKSILFRYL